MTLLSKKNKKNAIMYGAVGILCFVLKLKFYYGLVCFAVAGMYVWLSIKAEKKEEKLEEKVSEMDKLFSEAEDDYTTEDKKRMNKMLSAFGKKESKKKDIQSQPLESEELSTLNEYISKLDDDLAEMEDVDDYEE